LTYWKFYDIIELRRERRLDFMPNNKIDYTQELFGAIDMIVENRIRNIPIDKTIVCTIIDNTFAKNEGKYTVSDGEVRFEAYSEKELPYAVNE
jgi:hypothetical protein